MALGEDEEDGDVDGAGLLVGSSDGSQLMDGASLGSWLLDGARVRVGDTLGKSEGDIVAVGSKVGSSLGLSVILVVG